MPRYLIEVAYKGTNYSGFQVQQNANTIQAEVQKALSIIYKDVFHLTGSSRTDAGVHAYQNFFHFDTLINISNNTYHLNAILPSDIVIKGISIVKDDFHCRFNAASRQYIYTISLSKNPFNQEFAYHYPFKVDLDVLNQAALVVLQNNDFTSFSKKNTQVFTHICSISKCEWTISQNQLIFTVHANRFLRGMVRALVATMLQVGNGKISLIQFIEIIQSKKSSLANFSAPAHGLILSRVIY